MAGKQRINGGPKLVKEHFSKLAILLLACPICPGETFEDQFHATLMEKGWTRCLNELDAYPPDQRRHILEKALRAFGSDKPPRSQERQMNFDKAQSLAISTPGHAQYYQDQIEFYRTEALANAKKSEDELTDLRERGKQVIEVGDFETYCEVTAFRILGLLPSPEAVAVIGHYLNDPLGKDGKTLIGIKISTPYDSSTKPLISEMAAMAIRKLGIEHPPFHEAERSDELNFITEGEVEAWKQWWNEIVAGKRTYRFIGSDIDYGPDGPASPELIQKIQRNQRREEAGRTGSRQSEAGKEVASTPSKLSTRSAITALIASCLLLTAGLWYFIGRRVSAN